ncbi:MAG TPA: FAD-dependent oxidoreductase, partial [Alicyclobacillus sp.]|nr:FAD-dependent oxidoreductase [Alicyclobacillus sp.]
AVLLTRTQVWAIESGWTVYTADAANRTGGTEREIRAGAVLLATGAVERPLPLPGWTLPGVMTIGAAQVLTNVYRVKPGRRVLIAGVDVLSLTIGRAMVMAGVDVLGIVLPAANRLAWGKGDPRRILTDLRAVAHLAPSALLRMGRLMLEHPLGVELAARFYPAEGLKVWGIPIQLRKALVAIHGREQVTGAEIADIDSRGRIVPGTSEVLAVDAVCLSGGLTPLGELAATVGCEFVRVEGLNGAVPLHGPELETTVPGIFVAGNITGIEGAKVAMAQGELAGISICRRLGIGGVTEQEVGEAQEKLASIRDRADIQFHPRIREGRRVLNELWDKAKGEEFVPRTV